MKKTLSVIPAVLLALILLLPSLSSAERHVVTAVAADIDPDRLVSVAGDARITAYDEAADALTVEIIVPERYAPEEIEALQPGDAIYTQGQEVEIRTVTENSGYIVLNEGPYEFSEGSVWLYQGIDLNYWITAYEDSSWVILDTRQIPVPDSLLFLDEINPSSGEGLLHPAVHSKAEFLSMFREEQKEGPGFAANNVMVAFDENGALALIRRYYVPWQ